VKELNLVLEEEAEEWDVEQEEDEDLSNSKFFIVVLFT
jgi:hypothetical protein